jgi:hypothetical protein
MLISLMFLSLNPKNGGEGKEGEESESRKRKKELEGSMGRLGAPRAGLMSKASRGRAPSVK